nr:hypothetical protein CFP56_28667 [Quercus suber]
MECHHPGRPRERSCSKLSATRTRDVCDDNAEAVHCTLYTDKACLVRSPSSSTVYKQSCANQSRRDFAATTYLALRVQGHVFIKNQVTSPRKPYYKLSKLIQYRFHFAVDVVASHEHPHTRHLRKGCALSPASVLSSRHCDDGDCSDGGLMLTRRGLVQESAPCSQVCDRVLGNVDVAPVDILRMSRDGQANLAVVVHAVDTTMS